MNSARRRFRWTWLLALALLLGLVGSTAATLLGPSPLKPNAKDTSAAARVVPPQAQTLDERVDLPPGELVGGNGVVEPVGREINVAGDVPGRIALIVAAEGRFVEEGTALVRLDDGLERAAVAAAEADVAAARAELAGVEAGSRSQEIATAAAELRASEARSSLAQSVLERTKGLRDQGVATDDQLDRARQDAVAARAAASAARARKELLEAGARSQDVDLARARLQSAEARRTQAQAALDQRTVRAPTAGEVLQLKYRPGEYYQPGQGEPLLVLGDTRRLQVRMDLDERDIGRVHIGAPATVVVPAQPGVHFHGTITEIGRRVGRKNVRTDDPTERNDALILEVVVALDQPDGLVVRQRVLTFVQVAPPPDR